MTGVTSSEKDFVKTEENSLEAEKVRKVEGVMSFFLLL